MRVRSVGHATRVVGVVGRHSATCPTMTRAPDDGPTTTRARRGRRRAERVLDATRRRRSWRLGAALMTTTTGDDERDERDDDDARDDARDEGDDARDDARETSDEDAKREALDELSALLRIDMRTGTPYDDDDDGDDDGARTGGGAVGVEAAAVGGRRATGVVDGAHDAAPRAMMCVFEGERRRRDVGDGGGGGGNDGSESESDESESDESESEAYELRVGMAYGTRVVVAEWRGMDAVRVDDDDDDDGEDDALDSDDEYGGYSSSSSEDDIKRMKRRRERPLTPAKMIELKDDATPHTGIIRVFKVSDDGKWFITAGDDKMVKLWSTDSWTCARTVSMPKKVSAAAFTHDSKHYFCADKFGEVHSCAVDDSADPVLVLGHCSTIITDLECMAGGKTGYVLTGDRENKIRVSVMPKPEDRMRFPGSAPEIQSFCYAHTAHVSCVRKVVQKPKVLEEWTTKDTFISASADSYLRMWDAASGKETDPGAAIAFNNGTIVDVATRYEGSHVAVALEGRDTLGVVHLTQFRGVPKLFLVGWGPKWQHAPQSIKFDRQMLLFGVGLKTNDDGSTSAVLMREGKVLDGLEITLSADEAAGKSLTTCFTKKIMSEDQRNSRKKDRRDVKLKRKAEEQL